MKRRNSAKPKQEATGSQASRRRPFRNLLGRSQGSISVEFGLLAPIFLLLVFGVIDFGHAWYMKIQVTTASREGARYGTRYQTDSKGVHIIPTSLNPSITSWVTSSYSSLLPADANLQVTPGGAGYTSGEAGADLTVKVTATKNWFIINNLVPTLGRSITVSATTAMKVE